MADEADRAQMDIERYAESMQTTYTLPDGQPGECDVCGDWCGRLIGGCCARCRDKYKLP